MGKIRNPKNSYILLRQINDELCKAHGLSVIEKPKKRNREEMPAVKYGKSHKEQLRQTIDRVLPNSQSYEDFLAKMRSEGYEVKEGK